MFFSKTYITHSLESILNNCYEKSSCIKLQCFDISEWDCRHGYHPYFLDLMNVIYERDPSFYVHGGDKDCNIYVPFLPLVHSFACILSSKGRNTIAFILLKELDQIDKNVLKSYRL